MKNQNKKTKLKTNQENPHFNWKNLTKKTYQNMLKNNITDYVGKAAIGDIEAEFIYNKAEKYLDINLYYGTLKEKKHIHIPEKKTDWTMDSKMPQDLPEISFPKNIKNSKKQQKKIYWKQLKKPALRNMLFVQQGSGKRKITTINL